MCRLAAVDRCAVLEVPLILIADNDPDVNGLLQEVLARQGLAAEAVLDGVDALARLRRGGIRLLICDWDMPRMDGQGVLEHLHELPVAPEVVVMSGYLDPVTVARVRANPRVRAVLHKPFDVFALAEMAQGVVGPQG